jgi:hypothetical protein
MPPIVIPPLIAWAIGAIGAALAVRWGMKEWRRVNAELDDVSKRPVGEGAERGAPKTLKRDPETGVYKPE